MPYRFSRSRASRGTIISYKDSITHRPQGGGTKKQGLLPVVGTGQFSLWNGMRRAGSTPKQRNMVFSMNQIGGIGAVGSGNRSRMFAATANGARKVISPCLSPNVASALTILEKYAETQGKNLCLAGVSENIHKDIFDAGDGDNKGFEKLSSENTLLPEEVRYAVKTINDLKLTFPVSSPTDIQIHVVALIDNAGANLLKEAGFGIETLCKRIIAYGKKCNISLESATFIYKEDVNEDTGQLNYLGGDAEKFPYLELKFETFQPPTGAQLQFSITAIVPPAADGFFSSNEGHLKGNLLSGDITKATKEGGSFQITTKAGFFHNTINFQLDSNLWNKDFTIQIPFQVTKDGEVQSQQFGNGSPFDDSKPPRVTNTLNNLLSLPNTKFSLLGANRADCNSVQLKLELKK